MSAGLLLRGLRARLKPGALSLDIDGMRNALAKRGLYHEDTARG